MLAKLVDNSSGKYWYKVLEDVEYALNHTINASTGEIPSILLFGVRQKGKNIDSIREYLENTTTSNDRDLQNVRAQAQVRTTLSQEYNKKHYDKHRKKGHQFSVGDYVMIKNFDSAPGVAKKLIPSFKGPYEIDKELRNDRYLLKDIAGFQVSQKPYHGVWEAANLRPWHRGLQSDNLS